MLLKSALEVEVTEEGGKQLKEQSETSSTRHYRWLNQEAVVRQIMGSGKREKECRWSLSRLFGEGLHVGTVGVDVWLAPAVWLSPLIPPK